MMESRLPARMTVQDMCAAFGVKRARLYQLIAAGQFDLFELKPRIGRRAWSGLLVERYLQGEVIQAPKVTRARIPQTRRTA